MGVTVVHGRNTRTILADRTKCVGCFRCALTCSFRNEKGFNVGYSRIYVVPPDRSTIQGETEIYFAEECDVCGMCVGACAYGALTFDKQSKEDIH